MNPDDVYTYTRRTETKKQGKFRTRSIVALVVLFFFCFGVGWGSAGAIDLYRVMSNLGENGIDADDPALTAENPTNLPERVNVLIIGADTRPNETRARSDVLMVASIDRSTGRIAVLSVPRDTRVNIPGYGNNKINAAYAFGGAKLAVKTVESVVGIKIPYYVATNFNGFKDIIDTLGGVTINVEQRMYKPAEGINLKPGQQRLNGTGALGFVRYRDLPLGDIDRVENQKKFLMALAEEALQLKTITRLPQLIPQIQNCVDTNFTPGEMLDLAVAAVKVDPQNMVVTTLPGDFLELPGGSYWQVNTKLAAGLMDRLMEPGAVAPEWQPTSIVMRPPTTEKSTSNGSTGDKDKTADSTKSTKPSDSTNSGSKTNTGTNGKTGDSSQKTGDSANKNGDSKSSKTGDSSSKTGDSTSKTGTNTGTNTDTKSGAKTNTASPAKPDPKTNTATKTTAPVKTS